MANGDRIKQSIQSVVQQMMDRVMNRVLVDDPFIVENHRSMKPLYAALVPDEIFKGAHFERRFVTPFGKVWERLAEVAANEGLGFGTLNYTIRGNVATERLRRIQEILDALEHPGRGQDKRKPNWDRELEYILEGNGPPVPTVVICDVYAEDYANDKRYAFELKAPLPNSDQTKVSKEKLLKLHCMEPRRIDEAYYALPYNPYGRRQDYAWTFPARWFNMQEDKAVLIGNEFWDKVGGRGTFQSFITAINESGFIYRSRIYREFLGIEPPDTLDPSL